MPFMRGRLYRFCVRFCGWKSVEDVPDSYWAGARIGFVYANCLLLIPVLVVLALVIF